MLRTNNIRFPFQTILPVLGAAGLAGGALSGLFGGGGGAPQANIGPPGSFNFNPEQKGAARTQGLDTLLQILQGQGQTSPLAFNRQVADISRGTQAQQQGTQAELARQGLAGSGVGQFIGALQGQAGEDRQAGLLANETQLAEQRMRSDLGLLLQLIMQPALQKKGIDAGVAINNAGFQTTQNTQQTGAGLGALSGLFDALFNSGG